MNFMSPRFPCNDNVFITHFINLSCESLILLTNLCQHRKLPIKKSIKRLPKKFENHILKRAPCFQLFSLTGITH